MKLKDKLLQYNLVKDNDYLIKYVELIENNLTNDFEKFSMHRHHIIPKYYFKYNNLDCDNTRENIVNLRYSDHILAHFYLFKCSSNTYYEFCNAEALLKFIHVLPKDESEILKNKVDLDAVEIRRRQLFSEQFKGHAVTDTTRYKISQSNKLTRLHNKYKYIHKGDIETCVPEVLLTEYLNNGWEIGVKRKLSAWNKGLKLNNNETKALQRKAKLGKIHVHKDNKDKLIDKNLIDDYLSNGWSLGRCQSTKTAISKGSLGKISAFKGKHHTEANRIAIGKANSGGKYINKDGIVKHINIEELDDYIAAGWVIGNLNKTKGTFRWMNNGIITKRVKIEDIDEFISNGYTFGRIL